MCELTTSQKHIITELNNSRGEYKPAFMQIRIHCIIIYRYKFA